MRGRPGIIVSCLYLPNGNPQPGRRYTYKLAWFERLIAHAATILEAGVPAVVAGDYNVVPTDRDIYATRPYLENALLQPEPRSAYRRLLIRGWTDALRRFYPDKPMFTFCDYMRERWSRDAGRRLDRLLLSLGLSGRFVGAGDDVGLRRTTFRTLYRCSNACPGCRSGSCLTRTMFAALSRPRLEQGRTPGGSS